MTAPVLLTGRCLSEEERRVTQAAQEAVVCYTPINSLGFCRKGSSVTIGVTFMALKAGLFEVRSARVSATNATVTLGVCDNDTLTLGVQGNDTLTLGVQSSDTLTLGETGH